MHQNDGLRCIAHPLQRLSLHDQMAEAQTGETSVGFPF
jgi:hypothetical protein